MFRFWSSCQSRVPCSQQGSRRLCDWLGQQRESGSLVRTVVAIRESFVAGILVVGIYAQRPQLNHGTHQVETRILVPSSALIEIHIGNKNNNPEQQRTDSNQTTLCGNIHRGLGSKLEWIIPILKSTGKL